MAKPQIGVSHCIHISLSFIIFDYITQYIKNKLPKILFFCLYLTEAKDVYVNLLDENIFLLKSTGIDPIRIHLTTISPAIEDEKCLL